MQKSSMLILIGIFTILLSATYVILHRSRHSTDNSFASLTPLIRQIMVMDINKTGNFTPEAVLAGQLPILAINESSDPNDYKKIQLAFLDKVGRLFVYATSNDNSINTLDPVFSRMDLVYINSKKIVDVIAIADAGVRSIYLDPQHRASTELFPGGPKGYWDVVNAAILADGSKRDIRVIPITASDLPYS